MSFILLLIIICLFFGLFLLAFVLRIIGVVLRPFRYLFNMSKSREPDSKGNQNIRNFQKSNSQKIFDAKEGEYVDFEEIDERE